MCVRSSFPELIESGDRIRHRTPRSGADHPSGRSAARDRNLLLRGLSDKWHRRLKDYIKDKLLTSHGREVQRLPPYNCDLNPMALTKKEESRMKLWISLKVKLTLEALSSIMVED
ncbi:hypothetical protein EVAR_53355_1 [Eumeta japonica]|uniref:Uncharacterized protein n=1 Tax=Eumeta variegata TaxID=151549 RepID=A0A4C1YIK8_EUMVA|nr:hypothetical protein EVAR_53355_1 [Eumeta japonica]